MKREIKEALDEIAQSDASGRLQAQAIVERARARSSVLHKCFTWEDGKAASLWRLEEARALIRSYSVVIEQKPPIITRAYVSLKSVRAKGGGYTSIHRVLSDEEMRQELLHDGLEELAEMERRYGKLQELQPVFMEAREVRRRVAKKRASRTTGSHATV
jgi:hypothetical protein